MRRPPIGLAAGILALLFLAAGAARGDDWPQFRRDGSRSGSSSDPLNLPLTEVWSSAATVVPGASPLFGVALWKGRAYYVIVSAATKGYRTLVCADVRTGTVLWQRQLKTKRLDSPLSHQVAPAVSETGVVFVYDQERAATLETFRLHADNPSGDAEAAGRLSSYFRNRIAPAFRAGYLSAVNAEGSLHPGYEETHGAVQGGFRDPGRPPDNRAPGNNPPMRSPGRPASLTARMSWQAPLVFCVKSYDAVSGRPGPKVYLRQVKMREPIDNIVLHHPPLAHELRPGPSEAERWQIFFHTGHPWHTLPRQSLGHPLIEGETFQATSLSNLVFWWRPRFIPWNERVTRPEQNLRNTFVQHTHSLPGVATLLPSLFGGFPPVLGREGIIVGDDLSHRFLGVPSPGPGAWHVDIATRMGIPATDTEAVYVGLGGPGATQAIAAFEGGRPRWRYAPDGLIGEGQRRNYDPGLASGHWTNAGLALAGGNVYGEVNDTIVALDRGTGAVRWKFSLKPRSFVRSLVAAKSHLVVCVTAGGVIRAPVWESQVGGEHFLLGLRLVDGKLLWEQRISRPGTLALSEGMLYLADGDLRAFAPAERTFAMAADSPRREDYRRRPAKTEEPEAEAPADEVPAPEAAPAPPVAGLADATVLRLKWDEGLPRMLEKLQQRRQVAAAGVPLLLSLDRMNPERSAWLGTGTEPPYSPEWLSRYGEVCRKLAAVGRPEHFEVLPEINVYLARFPRELENIRAAARVLAREIHAASPQTRVSLSFNVEVLSRTYSRGDYRPFGKLQLPTPKVLMEVIALTTEVDEVGLTSVPQSSLIRPEGLSHSYYLLPIVRALNRKPVLITRVAVRKEDHPLVGETKQAQYVRRFFQACYWLGASVVAYPDLLAESKEAPGAELALRAGEETRAGLAVWQEVLQWKRVGRLTLGTWSDAQLPEPEPEQ